MEEQNQPNTSEAASPQPEELINPNSLNLQQNKVPQSIKPKTSHKKLIVAIIIAVLIIAGVATWLIWHLGRNSSNATPGSNQSSVVQQKNVNPAKTIDANLLAKPQKISNIHLFTALNDYFPAITACDSNGTCDNERPMTYSDLSYLKLGTTPQGDLIAITYNYDGGGPYFNGEQIIVQQNGNSYKILAPYTSDLQPHSDTNGSNAKALQKVLEHNVSIEANVDIPALDFPTPISFAGSTISYSKTISNKQTAGIALVNGAGDLTGSVAKGTAPVKIGSADGKNIYEITADKEANFEIKSIYATASEVFGANYQLELPLPTPESSSKNTKINWTSGGISSSSDYFNGAIGCGIGGYAVATGLTKQDLTNIGTTTDGTPVYSLPDNSALLKSIYKENYINNYINNYTAQKSLQNMSLAQFQDHHSVVVLIDSLGEIVIYERSDVLQVEGCGKPVVYLYPTKTTRVDIRVGADVTKSDPFYQNGIGWLNVLAKPDGQLNYQGKNYNSLFWEGHGYGHYPVIASGTIVKSSQAKSTIRQQLAKQGLKPNEINDFMDFWGTRLPRTPYVRLTWLNTQAMQKIAPLKISPSPQTMIRVFLDFEGLNKPIKLAPQHLSAPARSGFTVVEWGGLLKN